MDTVSMRELNQKTSEVVRDVALNRRTVTITNKGEPVGVQLMPVTRGPGFLDQLVAAGRATAPSVHGLIKAPSEHGAAVDVANELATDRDEERW